MNPGLDQYADQPLRNTLAFQAFQVLRRSAEGPEIVEEEIVEKLVSDKETSEKKRVLSRLVQLSKPSDRVSSPLIRWIETTPSGDDPLSQEIAASIARAWLFQNEIDEQVRDKMAVVLESSHQIANDFWFRFFSVRARDIELLMNEGRVSSERVFPEVIAKVTTGRMFDILFDENTTEKDSIQAMIWFANLPDLGSYLEKWGMLDRRKVLHDKFKVLLANVIQSGDFSKMVSIDLRLVTFSIPNFGDVRMTLTSTCLWSIPCWLQIEVMLPNHCSLKNICCASTVWGWQMSSRKNALQFSKCSLRMWLSFISKSIMSLSAVYREFRIRTLRGRLVKVNLSRGDNQDS